MDRFAPQKGRLRPFLLCGLSVGPIEPIRPIGLGGGGWVFDQVVGVGEFLVRILVGGVIFLWEKFGNRQWNH